MTAVLTDARQAQSVLDLCQKRIPIMIRSGDFLDRIVTKLSGLEQGHLGRRSPSCFPAAAQAANSKKHSYKKLDPESGCPTSPPWENGAQNSLG